LVGLGLSPPKVTFLVASLRMTNPLSYDE